MLRKKNSKGVILEQKGTRMAEDGEDWNGLEMTILKSLAIFFWRHSGIITSLVRFAIKSLWTGSQINLLNHPWKCFIHNACFVQTCPTANKWQFVIFSIPWEFSGLSGIAEFVWRARLVSCLRSTLHNWRSLPTNKTNGLNNVRTFLMSVQFAFVHVVQEKNVSWSSTLNGVNSAQGPILAWIATVPVELSPSHFSAACKFGSGAKKKCRGGGKCTLLLSHFMFFFLFCFCVPRNFSHLKGTLATRVEAIPVVPCKGVWELTLPQFRGSKKSSTRS